MISLVDYSDLYGVIINSYKEKIYCYPTAEYVCNVIKYTFDFIDGFFKRTFLISVLYAWINGIHLAAALKAIVVFNFLYLILCVFRQSLVRFNIRHQKLAHLLSQIDSLASDHNYENLTNDAKINRCIQDLNQYDINMNFWPLKFTPSVENSDTPKSVDLDNKVFAFIIFILSYFVGIPLIYPGVGFVIRILLGGSLVQGRISIRHTNKIFRMLIKTPTNDLLDTAFVDRRTKSNEFGKTLFILSEGNASFYEIGTFHSVVLSTCYSCLGWNHPGFAESKGIPFSSHIESSSVSIMDYAINYLGFNEEDIVLLGWSIGGYPSCYAASKYKNIKCLILDATFSDLHQVALTKFPLLEPLINYCIPKYFALNNSKVLEKYPGPIKMIIRAHDQVLMHKSQGKLEHHSLLLALDVVGHRYPAIFTSARIAEIEPTLRCWLETGKKLHKDGTKISFPNVGFFSQLKTSTSPEVTHTDEELNCMALELLGYYFSVECTDHAFRCSSGLMDLPTTKI